MCTEEEFMGMQCVPQHGRLSYSLKSHENFETRHVHLCRVVSQTWHSFPIRANALTHNIFNFNFLRLRFYTVAFLFRTRLLLNSFNKKCTICIFYLISLTFYFHSLLQFDFVLPSHLTFWLGLLLYKIAVVNYFNFIRQFLIFVTIKLILCRS